MRYIISAFLLLSLSTFPLLALKKTNKKIPDYSNIERDKVPFEYTWKLEDIYPDLAAWKADREKAFKLSDSIDEKARDWTSSPQKMLELIDYISEIQIIGTRLYGYASQHSNVEMSNTEYQKLKGDVRNLFIRFGTKIAFLQPDILKLGKETFDKYLKEEPKLEPYRQKVDTVLRMKDHILSIDKEQLITMTGLFSGAAQQASEMLNNVDIPKPKVALSDGKTYELNYPTYSRLRESKNPEDRINNMAMYWGNHKLYENTFSILIDGEMKLHLFNSQIRNYKNCLEAALYSDNINTTVYLNLIKAVRANLDPLHRYLRLKQKLLGIEKFKYPDIYASAVKKIDKEFEWEEVEKLIMDSMLPLGLEYQNALKEAFIKRWIDRYPNKDKESGAYSSSVYGIHPYIKMNYTGNYSSVSTLAHELGHSLHSYFSDKTQHYANHDYSSFLAEIASTFNENLLMKHLLKVEKDDLFKLYILDSFFDQIRGSIYRQTLFAEFELAMHEQVENGGTLTADWLDKKYLDLTRLYYGHDKGVCQVDEFIQNEWSGIPHFFYNFYVYQYSTGFMASMALSQMVINEGDRARDRYLNFLKAGSSKYPLDILKDAGLDLTNPETLNKAFIQLDELITEMERIADRLIKAGKL